MLELVIVILVSIRPSPRDQTLLSPSAVPEHFLFHVPFLTAAGFLINTPSIFTNAPANASLWGSSHASACAS